MKQFNTGLVGWRKWAVIASVALFVIGVIGSIASSNSDPSEDTWAGTTTVGPTTTSGPVATVPIVTLALPVPTTVPAVTTTRAPVTTTTTTTPAPTTTSAPQSVSLANTARANMTYAGFPAQALVITDQAFDDLAAPTCNIARTVDDSAVFAAIAIPTAIDKGIEEDVAIALLASVLTAYCPDVVAEWS